MGSLMEARRRILLSSPHLETIQNADIASFSTDMRSPLRALTLRIDPIQDLHGYDSPWPAGGGVNILDPNIVLTAEVINDVTLTTTDGYKFHVSGTCSGPDASVFRSNLIIFGDGIVLPAGTYTLPTGITAQIRKATDGSFLANAINTFTAEQSFYVCQVWYIVSVNSTVNFDRFIGLARGSTAPTSWSPYSNLCPISGWSAANLWRTGKNLFDKSKAGTIGIITWCYENEGFLLKKGQSYTLSVGSIGSTGVFDSISFYGTDKTTQLAISYQSSLTYTPSKDMLVLPRFYKYPTCTQEGIDTVKLELSSTPTPYAPYTGNQFTIQLGQTVYGGNVDVINGVLTVTHAVVDMSTLSWSKGKAETQALGSYAYFNATPPAQKAGNANFISSSYRAVDSNRNNLYNGQMGVYNKNSSGYRQLAVRNDAYADSTGTEFATAMSGQTIVYELATPITIPLTPTEISTLAGQNVVWGDCGEIELLKYWTH